MSVRPSWTIQPQSDQPRMEELFSQPYSLFLVWFFDCIGSLLLGKWGLLSSCVAWASHCGGFSCCGTWALGAWSSVGAVAVCWLSSCGSWALFAHGMWNLPGPEIEPISPALAGRFLSTIPTPLGKSIYPYSLKKFLKVYCSKTLCWEWFVTQGILTDTQILQMSLKGLCDLKKKNHVSTS